MRLLDRLKELREAIRSTALASGAMDIRVFGSVARGEEGERSDIDFLVSLKPGRSLLDLARLELQLEKLLGHPVDVVTINGLREPIRSTAVRESMLV
jgi:predicted nucleotidyltransferase